MKIGDRVRVIRDKCRGHCNAIGKTGTIVDRGTTYDFHVSFDSTVYCGQSPLRRCAFNEEDLEIARDSIL